MFLKEILITIDSKTSFYIVRFFITKKLRISLTAVFKLNALLGKAVHRELIGHLLTT